MTQQNYSGMREDFQQTVCRDVGPSISDHRRPHFNIDGQQLNRACTVAPMCGSRALLCSQILKSGTNCGIAGFREWGLEYRPAAAPKVYRGSGVEVYRKSTVRGIRRQ